MKYTLLFIALILTTARAFSQPTFVNSYLIAQDTSVASRPLLVKCSDGSLMGTSVYYGPNSFLLFKISTSGNMIWQKAISIEDTSLELPIPLKVCALTDSAIAIVLDIYNMNGFVIVKCDLSGNVIWSSSFFPQSGSGVPDIVADVNGGMIVTAQNRISFVNSNGSINNTILPTSARFIQSVSIGNGSVRVFGYRPSNNPVQSTYLCDISPSGTVSNYVELFFNDTLYLGNVLPSYLISKAPSGNMYCMYLLDQNPVTMFMIACFDSFGQPLWAKKVKKDNMIPRTIVAGDDGCIIAADLGAGFYKTLMVMKIDNSGDYLWTKFPGDPQDPNWDYFVIHSIIPDQGNGWYCVTTNDNLQLAHTDSSFDGFCNYRTDTSASITDLIYTSGSNTISTTSCGYTSTPLATSIIPQRYYRYDACSGILLDSTFGILENKLPEIGFEVYPNPAKDYVTVELEKNIRNGMISVFNSYGEVVTSFRVEGILKKEISLDQLSSGIYMISIVSEESIGSRKLVISK